MSNPFLGVKCLGKCFDQEDLMSEFRNQPGPEPNAPDSKHNLVEKYLITGL